MKRYLNDNVVSRIYTRHYTYLKDIINPEDWELVYAKYDKLIKVIGDNFSLSTNTAERIVGFSDGPYMHHSHTRKVKRDAVFYEAFYIILHQHMKRVLAGLESPHNGVSGGPATWMVNFVNVTKLDRKRFVDSLGYANLTPEYQAITNAIYVSRRKPNIVGCRLVYDIYKTNVEAGLETLQRELILARYFLQ